MFDLNPSPLSGCCELQPNVYEDARGRFIKVFHQQAFAALGLETIFTEEYYSVSFKHVIRGLHFQLPPMDHVKLVCCVAGNVIDVVVDLRVGSPTYGQHELFELSAAKGNSIYIPKGMAHGFCVLSDQAVMVYNASTIYSPELDAGVRWDSAGVLWPTTQAILSVRDQSFSSLDQFVSPFRYE